MRKGFTLIEMSIVLVIIGLIVGGVLVGRDLISAAAVRAQISQIEKYQTAVNTFHAKYGYLPGDIPDPTASQYGFAARGNNPGEGDGNGVIEGPLGTASIGWLIFTGESGAFWADLSQANLINGGFTAGASNILSQPIVVSQTQVANYLPPAKLGQGNYIAVWSGGWQLFAAMDIGGAAPDQKNYFSISSVVGCGVANGLAYTNVGMSVAQAYSIDKKIDDGLPQSGRVLALNNPGLNAGWAIGGQNSATGANGMGANDGNDGPVIPGDGISTAPTADTCYDNSSVAGGVEKYSMSQNGGAGLNCALSLQFQ